MKRHRHDAICDVERLLDAVTVVDIDVDVQDAGVVLEQLEDGEDDVVDVAEPRCLRLLRVVQPSAPIHADVRVLIVQLHRSIEGRASVQLAILVEPIEDGAVGVLTDGKLVHHCRALPLHAVRRKLLQKVHVVRRVELRHLLRSCRVRTVHLHLPIELVRKQKVVRQLHPNRLHRVRRPIVVVSDVLVVEVAHALLRSRSRKRVAHTRYSIRSRARRPRGTNLRVER